MNWNQIKWCQKCCSVQPFSDVLCNVAMAHTEEESCPADLQEPNRLWTLVLTQLLPSAERIKKISILHAYDRSDPPLHPPIASVYLPSRLMFSLFLFFSPLSCSVRPAVVLATGTVWSCVRAGRAETHCQSPSAPNMAGPPPGCAVTCSAALPLSGWRVPGERWDRLLVYCRSGTFLYTSVSVFVLKYIPQFKYLYARCVCVSVFCQVWSGSGDAFSAVSDPHRPAVQWVSGTSAASSHAAVQEQMWPQSARQYRQPRRSEVKVHLLLLLMFQRNNNRERLQVAYEQNVKLLYSN